MSLPESESLQQSRPRRRKLRSIADPRSINNYLGSFKSQLILGNVQTIVNGEQLFSIKESKWNFINDSRQVKNYLQLEESKKLRKEDVSVNLMEELTKNPCNQDVIVNYGSFREKKYCLLKHKFSEMWRFPIYCNFIELRVEPCDDEELVENRLFNEISSQMNQNDSIMESDFEKVIPNAKDSQQKMSNEEILGINRFRQIMKSNMANATKVNCNVHVYIKQHFYTFPLNIQKGVLERGCTNFQELSINEQIELLTKDSLYLLLGLLDIDRANKLDIPLNKKIPIMSQYYKLKSRKNILESHRMNIILPDKKKVIETSEEDKQQQNESEIYQLIKEEYLDTLDNISFSDVIAPNKQQMDKENQSDDNDNNGSEENQELEDYDDKEEEDLIYENLEQDGDTVQEDRSNIEEGKNFKKTITPTQMLKHYELKEYQQQGLTWMLHREQKISKKKLYEQKWQILGGNSVHSYKDITMAYELYQVQNSLSEDQIQFYYNPLNGHSCLDLEFEEDEQPVQGGILADQMGLGKTIQAIALLLQAKYKDYLNEPDSNKNTKLQKAKNTRKFYMKEEESDEEYRASEDDEDEEDSACKDNEPDEDKTLIIVPKSLVSQWQVEIQQSLRDIESFQIYCYERGHKYNKKKKLFKGIEIVITTYGILAAEYKNIIQLILHLNPTESGKIRNGYLLNQKWERVILDEAHLIRNRTTQVSQAVCELNTTFRWCLTGTPLQNKIDDLFAYFRFLNVPQLGEWKWWSQVIAKNKNKEKTYQFIKAVLKGIMLRRTKNTKDQEGKPIIVLPKKTINVENILFNKFEGELYTTYFHNQQLLFANLLNAYEQRRDIRGQLHEQMFVMINNLRMMCNNFQMVKLFQDSNLKKLRQIIKELQKNAKKSNPEKDKWDYVLTKKENPALTDEQIQERLAKQGVNESSASQENLDGSDEDEELSEYKKLAKTDRVIQIIREAADKGEKVVVFTQWHDSINRLKQKFQDLDIDFNELHGKMTIKQRAKQVKEFFSYKSKSVMILSLMAGYVGLNLTCANNVIVMDPWWNAAVEDQAVDRIYRIGQRSDVNVYRCLINHDDSVDSRINELCKKKQIMCDKILSLSSEERSISSNLTIEDFKFIFGMSNAQIAEPQQIPNMQMIDMNNAINQSGNRTNMAMSQNENNRYSYGTNINNSANNNNLNTSMQKNYNGNQVYNNNRQINSYTMTSSMNSNNNQIFSSPFQVQNTITRDTQSPFNRVTNQQQNILNQGQNNLGRNEQSPLNRVTNQSLTFQYPQRPIHQQQQQGSSLQYQSSPLNKDIILHEQQKKQFQDQQNNMTNGSSKLIGQNQKQDSIEKKDQLFNRTNSLTFQQMQNETSDDEFSYENFVSNNSRKLKQLKNRRSRNQNISKNSLSSSSSSFLNQNQDQK